MSDLATLRTLEEAYFRGVMSVTHRGKSYVYTSHDKMWKAIQDLRRQLQARPVRAGVARVARW